MEKNRRDFLKLTGLAGIGLASTSIIPAYAALPADQPKPNLDDIRAQAMKKHTQHFNMSGYAAPALNVVRIGVVGLGNRGEIAVPRLIHIEGVDIKGLCDLRPEKVNAMLKVLQGTSHKPKTYSGYDEDWKKICEQDDIDLIYICLPWDLHTPVALYAMNHGKHVCVEVPAATTIDECWQLVETSEKTRKHCMMLENCNYDYFELLTLNMARQGMFGEIIHGEGAYLHNILQGNFSKGKYWNQWRLKQNASRNGNLYPTHGLGPLCQVMNINRGDKFDYLGSFSSNDFLMHQTAVQLAAKDSSYQQYVNTAFRGNINTSVIKTAKGKTIMLQHDVSSPQPGSRIFKLSGTKGVAMKYPDPARISFVKEWTDPEQWRNDPGDSWLNENEFKVLEEKHKPAIYRKIGREANIIGGHGGMDFVMDWRTIDCLRNGLPLDHDVYDAALWSSIGPLSEWSVANRSNSIDVPDFTGGSWKKNSPMDISIEKGGNTKVNV
jgi:predicted dehydrogenase